MTQKRWWRSEQGELCSAISDDISKIETTQLDMYERLYMYGAFYDPNGALGMSTFAGVVMAPVDNMVASSVDTITSVAARQTTRPVFLTDDGDWATKRRAAALARYSEGAAKLLRLQDEKPVMFRDSTVFGTAFRRFEIDAQGCVSSEKFLAFEVRVNEDECFSQKPRSLHLLKYREREWLMSQYPAHAADLDSAPGEAAGSWFGIPSYNTCDQLLVRESYRLPFGREGKDGFVPGRKVISTGALVLLDEEYLDAGFPVAVLRWSERSTGYMGRSLVEDLLPTQRNTSKMNSAVDMQIDYHASPITYVNANDLAVVEKSRTTKIGRFVPYLVAEPKTLIPPVIAPEIMQWMQHRLARAKENSGISDMHSHGQLGARLETGAAVRESSDVASERFSIQEKGVERYDLDCIKVTLMLIKRNHTKGLPTPEIGHSFAGINRRIKWKDVDMGDVAYQLQAAPMLSRTLAGRMDTVASWQNSGIITPEAARSLIRHPDLDSAMSMYESYIESVEKTADMLLDGGEYIAPDPRGHLEMGLDKMLQLYFKAIDDGAPEESLDLMRTWADQCSFILSKQTAPAPMPAMPGAPAPEMAPGPGVAP